MAADKIAATKNAGRPARPGTAVVVRAKSPLPVRQSPRSARPPARRPPVRRPVRRPARRPPRRGVVVRRPRSRGSVRIGRSRWTWDEVIGTAVVVLVLLALGRGATDSAASPAADTIADAAADASAEAAVAAVAPVAPADPPAPADPAAPAAPGAPAPAPGGSGCTIDDPTTGGCITPVTAHGLDQIAQAFGGYRDGPKILSAYCWDEHAWNPTSDHPKGKGCDLYTGRSGEFAAGPALDNGWELAKWLRMYADVLKVKYVIWQGRIWTNGKDDIDGWGQKYGGGGVYDATEPTGGHFDHIHVSFQR